MTLIVMLPVISGFYGQYIYMSMYYCEYVSHIVYMSDKVLLLTDKC